MLDLETVDLDLISEALEDQSPDHAWWFDPRSGEVEPRFESWSDEYDDEDPESRGLIWIAPIDSGESYRDLEDFIACVRDHRARDLLERAISGRGAFRRFKDTLFDFPDLRAAWFKFHDARTERRAVEWLMEKDLVDRAAAERAISEREDPQLPELSGPFDPHEVARQAAEELRGLYGDRLRQVLLFGSWARGDANPESDIDLLVVLDKTESVWDELRMMDSILWRHSFENDTVISAIPVSEADLERPSAPIFIRAKAEGLTIG